MKKSKLILAVLLALNFSSNAFAQSVEYKPEANHTSVLWTANHLGFSSVTGKFTDVTGKILFDEKNPQNSSVDVVINIKSLETGLPKFNKHLLSEDFFNVKKFETATFVSKKITVTGKNKANIEGNLTIHGITKVVVLDTVLNKIGANPFSKAPTIGLTAKASIKRSDFGINYAIPDVADRVDLVIQVEANK